MTFEPITEWITNGGPQKVYRFPNGYGASVIRNPGSYGSGSGLWELAVIKFHGPNGSFTLTYDTPITEDVLGYLQWGEVEDTLTKIKGLPDAD